jgi:DnaA family protein
MRQLVLDIQPAGPPTLDDFVVGRNAEVLAALRQWMNGVGERFIYLWGEPGAGKTHLLNAVDAVGATHLPQGLQGAESALHQQDVLISCDAQTRFEPSDASALRADNVERLSPEGAVSLFNRYNERREGTGRLLVTGYCAPAQLPLLPDLATRLGWGLVLRVHALDDSEKVAALQSRAQHLGAHLPADAARYILTRWTRDTSSLFALMNELNTWSLSAQRAITIPLIRDALTSIQRPAP